MYFYYFNYCIQYSQRMITINMLFSVFTKHVFALSHLYVIYSSIILYILYHTLLKFETNNFWSKLMQITIILHILNHFNYY